MNEQPGETECPHGERLAWYASGHLSAVERATIDAHLSGCGACRGQLAEEQRIASLVHDTALSARSPEPGLEQLLVRVRAARAGPAAAPAASGWRHALAWLAGRVPVPMPALAGACGLAIALGATYVYRAGPVALPAGEGEYRVLSSPPPGQLAEPNDIHLLLAPATTAARRDALLATIGGRVVAGPGAGGALTVRLDRVREPRDLASALERLRREPGVLLAEAAAPLAMPHVGPEQQP